MVREKEFPLRRRLQQSLPLCVGEQFYRKHSTTRVNYFRDNSTRGLDASTALDYANSLRVMTDASDRTTLVTLYQAGEGIYELMDKVLLIDEGRMIFQGPANEAKGYFIDLGFHCPERETTADFLTAITDPTQRIYREGFQAKAPKTAEELEKAFRSSPNYQKVLADVVEYEKHLGNTNFVDVREFKQSVKEQKSKNVSENSNFTVSFWSQVMVSDFDQHLVVVI